VFVDQAYWMGAIASKPSASYKGYILGGLMWFSIPFTLATSLGLASVAMDLPITKDEASAGLVPPATAVYILGNSGAIWVRGLLWLAAASAALAVPACHPPPRHGRHCQGGWSGTGGGACNVCSDPAGSAARC
jgi:hypothetical protein